MRASDRAYRTLLEEIQSGLLAPGTVIGEVDQSTRLGVSRTPLREAIGRLIADGLVRQVSPRVTVVSPIEAVDIVKLFALRRSLEESAAREAATRAGREAFAPLAAEFSAVDPRTDADGYYALIARFDAALDAAVDNAFFAAALRNVRTHLVRVRRLARDKPERLAASVGEHRLIAEAIAAGDTDLAAHATHVHLHNALASILDSLNTDTRTSTEGIPA